MEQKFRDEGKINLNLMIYLRHPGCFREEISRSPGRARTPPGRYPWRSRRQGAWGREEYRRPRPSDSWGRPGRRSSGGPKRRAGTPRATRPLPSSGHRRAGREDGGDQTRGWGRGRGSRRRRQRWRHRRRKRKGRRRRRRRRGGGGRGGTLASGGQSGA